MGKYKIITERGIFYVEAEGGKPEAYKKAKKILKEKYGLNEEIIVAVQPFDLDALRDCL